MEKLIVEIENLWFNYYNSKRNKRTKVLENISLQIFQNEFVSIIGPSGCGKSTLLKLIAGFEAPKKGKILIEGKLPQELRKEAKIGFIPQSPALYPWRTVKKNVALPLEIQKVEKEKREKIVKGIIELVGLGGKENNRPAELSGGEKQRVAIAASLTLNPVVLLMDEPFGALDAITRDKMNMALLDIWKERKTTILFITHNTEEALFLGDKVIVFTSAPGKIREKIKVPFRKRYLEIKKEPEFVELAARLRELLEK